MGNAAEGGRESSMWPGFKKGKQDHPGSHCAVTAVPAFNEGEEYCEGKKALSVILKDQGRAK